MVLTDLTINIYIYIKVKKKLIFYFYPFKLFCLLFDHILMPNNKNIKYLKINYEYLKYKI